MKKYRFTVEIEFDQGTLDEIAEEWGVERVEAEDFVFGSLQNEFVCFRIVEVEIKV